MPEDGFLKAVEDLSIEDFCVRVAQELVRRNAIPLEVKTSGTGKTTTSTTWGAFDLGPGTGLYRSIDLSAVQSRKLNTLHGVPMALGFRVTLIDVTHQAQAEARRKERQVQTATREIKKGDSMSNTALLDAVNRRRASEGKAPLTEL
jgi:hypothetical protein